MSLQKWERSTTQEYYMVYRLPVNWKCCKDRGHIVGNVHLYSVCSKYECSFSCITSLKMVAKCRPHSYLKRTRKFPPELKVCLRWRWFDGRRMDAALGSSRQKKDLFTESHHLPSSDEYRGWLARDFRFLFKYDPHKVGIFQHRQIFSHSPPPPPTTIITRSR